MAGSLLDDEGGKGLGLLDALRAKHRVDPIRLGRDAPPPLVQDISNRGGVVVDLGKPLPRILPCLQAAKGALRKRISSLAMRQKEGALETRKHKNHG